MIKLIERLCLVGLIASVVILTLTALPSLGGSHLGGNVLLVHMMSSGVLVFVLPMIAVLWLARGRAIGPARTVETVGFWAMILMGLVTIASVFIIMLPITSTETMHQLVNVHRYAGFATVPAVVLFVAGVLRYRRMHSIRSTTPG
ncbi:hypothetical protein [Novipirellula artificiosorum]|uniref:DUF4405 domain-containing protein n=1 Tax=Novipirellula artificiosorum TaxID=2528016 RepID=A0A5C6DX45_9BACT|nr:hypothetical protein [Novipirellula artificiosorum]TWU42003.1 hypothetical protein Poly41_02990 [Novipirellula artificiosorum]